MGLNQGIRIEVMRDKSGQAFVEYLLLFAIMSGLALAMVVGFSKTLDSTIRGVGRALTIELSTGICPRNCFYGAYRNGN